MTFEKLREFLTTQMRLSHIYQPLLIRSLIESGGVATVRQLAGVFLSHDESQIQYYEKRLKRMPIPVLKRRGVIEKDGDLVRLNVSKLNLVQQAELKQICEAKIQEYIQKRGIGIWDYRLLDDNPVTDSLRYRVLKDANGRCELCGATKDQRPLDVDHILPRSRGGKTEYENLQVLCSKCNRSKGNKDDTDFRQSVLESLEPDCLFCQGASTERVIAENDLAFATYDRYPVTEGHVLVVPKRHFADLFESTEVERKGVFDLVRLMRKRLCSEDGEIEGFNVGVNVGQVAGQTVGHCHIHLIPRRAGDCNNPRGGVRGVIDGKRAY